MSEKLHSSPITLITSRTYQFTLTTFKADGMPTCKATDWSIMADTSKTCNNFRRLYLVTKVLLNCDRFYSILVTMQNFTLRKPTIMDQFVTFRKRVYRMYQQKCNFWQFFHFYAILLDIPLFNQPALYVRRSKW